MKNLFLHSYLQYLWPVIILAAIVLIFNVSLKDTINSVQYFFMDHEYVSNMNWKAIR
jgi:hypothetical protein